jgi:hypothetical protein
MTKTRSRVSADAIFHSGDKQYIIKQFDDSGESYKVFVEKYNKRSNKKISATTLKSWKQGKGLKSGKGRFQAIAPAQLEAVADDIKDRQNKQKTPKRKEVSKMFSVAAKKTASSRNVHVFGTPKISPATERRYRRQINASNVAGQTKTKARIEAEADIRNLVSQAAVLGAAIEGVPPELLANFDACTVYLPPPGKTSMSQKHRKTLTIIKGHAAKKAKGKKPLAATSQQESGMDLVCHLLIVSCLSLLFLFLCFLSILHESLHPLIHT